MRIVIPALGYFSCSQFVMLGFMFVDSTKGAYIEGDSTVSVGRALFPPLGHCPRPEGSSGSQGALSAQGVYCYLFYIVPVSLGCDVLAHKNNEMYSLNTLVLSVKEEKYVLTKDCLDYLSPQIFGNWTFGTLVFTVMVFTVTLKVKSLMLMFLLLATVNPCMCRSSHL